MSLAPTKLQGSLAIGFDSQQTTMVSNCCCGDRCTMNGLSAPDKHWCPGCKQPIHAVCGVFDESQESIAYMNWCYNCDEGRKMPPQHLMQKQPPIRQTRQLTTRKRKSTPQTSTANVPFLDPPPHDKKQANRPVRNTGRFKIVVPAQQHDPLMGRQVAFPLDGTDCPQWLKNPLLQQYGEEIDGVRYLLGNVCRSKSSNSKSPYSIEWEATKCGTTPMDGGTVMLGIQQAVRIHEKNQIQKDMNRKQHPLDIKLRQKLLEVEDYEIGEHFSSDDDSDNNNDDESIYQDETPLKSSLTENSEVFMLCICAYI